MLQHLHIENLALIDAADLEFDAGFVTVTGETGAGKSVLLGALSLLAGNRASKSIIRQGANECRVEATLFFPDAERMDARLLALDLPPTEEGALILTRSVAQKKAGRVTVNGRTVPLATLATLGEHWIDFHGPGEPQKLFREAYQLEMLDLFAAHGTQLAAYREAYRQWCQTCRAIEQLHQTEALDEDEAAFLKHQLDAIEAVNLDPEALEQLERDFDRLDKSRDLREKSSEAVQRLSGARGMAAIGSDVLRTARELAALDAEAAPLAERVEQLIIEAEDISDEYRALAEAVDFDPQQAEQIQQRMSAWMDVRRRFGPAVEQVLAKRAQLRQRLGGRDDLDRRLHELEKQAAHEEAAARKLAQKLTAQRQQAATKLAERSRELLKRLGFKKPRLEIEVRPEKQLEPHGDSCCRYLFSPNPGQELMPLNAIASSGEAARVMLSLKTVLAEVDATPVLVFDEVDANVGGEIGKEVGRELGRLGSDHQVFCVTHLPQVAGQGRSHWLVEKHQDEAATRVTMRPLHTEPEERLGELARMLGDRHSDSARAHARELLGL